MNHHRFFLSGQAAARAENSNNITLVNVHKSWLKVALSQESGDNRKQAEDAFNQGMAMPNRLVSGLYL